MKPMRLLLASACAFSLLAAPATLAAQDMMEAETPAEEAPAEDPMAMLAGMMGGMVEVEPLTAEQEARMPAAEAIITKIMPPGAMGEMSQQMMGGFFGGFGDLIPNGPKPVLAELLGVGPMEIGELTDEQAAEAASLLDPAWDERQTMITGLVPELLGELMGTIEPSMRRAMAELYAIRFTDSELAGIDAFFSTETGGKYARESLSMASDKRLVAATMESMPAMFAMIGEMETRVKERTESLPAPRALADLSAAQKSRLAELTGFTVEEIESNLEGIGVVTMPADIPESEAEEVPVD